jgi:hypothetical protein
MIATENETAAAPPSRPGQDGMPTLREAGVGLAVVLLIVILLPDFLAVPLILCVAITVPALLTVALVSGTGGRRMFCIGALFPACTLLYTMGWLFGFCLLEPPGPDLDSVDKWLDLFDEVGSALRVYLAAAYLLAVGVGAATVWVHRRLEARGERDARGQGPQPAPPQPRDDFAAAPSDTSPVGRAAPSEADGPWQYSLKTLLVVTAAVAVALSIIVSSPDWIAVPMLMLLAIAVPALLTSVLVYGSGYQRTFCLGALFPTGIALYATGWAMGLALVDGDLDDLGEWLEFFEAAGNPYRVYSASAWLLAIAVGSAAVAIRRRLEARRSAQESA